MPPVSVTMHALNTCAVVVGVELLGLAHPATIKASTLNAAAVLAIPLTKPPNFPRISPRVQWAPKSVPWCATPPGVREDPELPSTCSQDDRRLDLVSRPGKAASIDPPGRCQIAIRSCSYDLPDGAVRSANGRSRRAFAMLAERFSIVQ